MSKEKESLARGLKSRHVMMIALGGAIGAGMFKGSSTAIDHAGPGVVIAYLLGGLILLNVMQGLAEMIIRNPQAKTFRDLIEPVLGRFAAHLVGWMYWIDWVLVMAAETAASASFLSYWFPNAPLWLLALIVSVVITLVNLFQVNVYGETEYWLAGVKVTVLIVFILFGGTLLFTGYAHHAGVGFHNLTAHGGFFPHGLSGLAASMLIVMFSFGGTETIGMTIGETENPEKVIPRAARSVILRILVFYVLPILVIVSLVPWNQLNGGTSPFVTVFQAVGVPYVGSIMNFVLLTAVLSATNTGMYAASRMLYTQALDGQAPRFFARLSARRIPLRALLTSTSFLYIGVIIAMVAQAQTFNYLMIIPGYSVLLVWMLLTFAHVVSHVRDAGTRRAPVLSVIALMALLAILFGIVVTLPVAGSIAALVAVIVVSVGYVFTRNSDSPLETKHHH